MSILHLDNFNLIRSPPDYHLVELLCYQYFDVEAIVNHLLTDALNLGLQAINFHLRQTLIRSYITHPDLQMRDR